MPNSHQYVDEIRTIRSLLIVTALQKKEDLRAKRFIEEFDAPLAWQPLSHLLIDEEVWNYIANTKQYDPKLVFCHPQILRFNTLTSLYYRGLCGLSLKAVKDYFGNVESLERQNQASRLSEDKALKMSRTYNLFICSIIKNSLDWTLENGYRTIIATLGITLDGKMRNKIGEIAEERIKSLMLEFLVNRGLISTPDIKEDDIIDKDTPRSFQLLKNISMEFGSEPDISFHSGEELLVVIEIKGGTDPAGALERYGAATKSFQHSVETSKRCKNFYLAAVFTPELERRINKDRLVEKAFDIIKILDDPGEREKFFKEIFHHALRII